MKAKIRIICMIPILFAGMAILSSCDDENNDTWTPENLTDPYTVDKTYVLDPLNYLTDIQTSEINALCDSLNNNAHLETAVVILDNIDYDDLDFGVKLYNKWRLGKDGRGILLLVVIEQHKWRFVTGYGAEEEFPDIIMGRIGNEKLVPQFRAEDYYRGIYDGFVELWTIATDKDYKNAEYLTDSTPKTEKTEEEIEQEKTLHEEYERIMYWFKRMLLLLIAVPFFSIYIDFYGLNNIPLKSVKGTFTHFATRDNPVVYFTNNEKMVKWSLWANSKFLWYILFIPVFIVLVLEAFDYGDYEGSECNICHFAPYTIAFFSYCAIVNIIMYFIRMREAKTEMDKMTMVEAVSHSTKLRCYIFLAPHIILLFYLYIIMRRNNLIEKNLKCQFCHEPLHRIHRTYKPTDEIRNKELGYGLAKPMTYACENGHFTTLLYVGSNVKKYIICPQCSTRTAKITGKEEKRKAEFDKKGLTIIKAKCICCGTEIEDKCEVPKLKDLFSISSPNGILGRSGGYNSSGGSSGGSRGVGYSGGGGAGGRW